MYSFLDSTEPRAKLRYVVIRREGCRMLKAPSWRRRVALMWAALGGRIGRE